MLCLEKIKDLIESLPEEIFEADAKLANKKRMADAAIEPLEDFLKRLLELLRDRLEDCTTSGGGECGRLPTIDPTVP